jgi:hypothetical protein
MRAQSSLSHNVGRRDGTTTPVSRGFPGYTYEKKRWQICARDVGVGEREVCVLFVFDFDLRKHKEPMQLSDVLSHSNSTTRFCMHHV